ncbi:MAG: sigma-70 family RNA polymerase sigma factor [Gemmataceae bacterium]
MAEAPATRITLLNRIRDGADSDAWAEFARLYGPVIYGFSRKRGLQDADAADLVQDVLRSVARNAPKLDYDPKRGTFRGWLYTITRNKIYNFLSANKNRPKASGDSGTHEQLDSTAETRDDPEGVWELEYQRRLAAKAMDRVKHEFQPNTWKAFWGTAVEGKSAAEVGSELKMSPGAVYVAKSRVTARLREEVQTITAETEAW